MNKIKHFEQSLLHVLRGTNWTRTVETERSTFYMNDFGFSWPLDKTLYRLRHYDLHQLHNDA